MTWEHVLLILFGIILVAVFVRDMRRRKNAPPGRPAPPGSWPDLPGGHDQDDDTGDDPDEEDDEGK